VNGKSTRESGAGFVDKCKRNASFALYSLCYVLEVEVMRETKPGDPGRGRRQIWYDAKSK
jgi:hypothetical protein